jgi:hypothetical protein
MSGTSAKMGRTKVSELRERIRLLGGEPKGSTVAALLDELEDLDAGGGGGSTVSIIPADVTESDIDSVFGD